MTLALAQRGTGKMGHELMQENTWLQIQFAAQLEARLMNEEAKRWQ